MANRIDYPRCFSGGCWFLVALLVPLVAADIHGMEAGAHEDKHWAFQPLVRQEPPGVQDGSWVANGVDAFILARLEAQGLAPAPRADLPTLARRVYYDVTGLPPSKEQLDKFLTDTRPDAYARLVDDLLASPGYGEKWARHWLDVVRYAETNSFERDARKPFVWKYRDYVIRAFNGDKSYGQFVLEQLAGDELESVTADSIIATGYYRLGTWDDEPADALQSKYDDLDNILSTTGQGFLGLTIGCARCHDHKIDPLPQTNYYGLLWFLEDLLPYALPKQRDPELHSLTDLSSPAVKKLRQELSSQVQKLKKSKQSMEQIAIQKMDVADQGRAKTSQRQKVLDEKLDQYLAESQQQAYRQLVSKLKALEKRLAKVPQKDFALSLAKCNPHPKKTHVMLRGNPHVLADQVEPSFPDLFGDRVPEIPTAPPTARSAGRRRVLAGWIASPENLLTARVIANRVWQHLLGRGIVRSSNNFGHMGTPPTHPELLDWLACWLTDHQWRLKSLHRLILNSSTYQMSSKTNGGHLLIDPNNDLYWRFDSRRLSAEEIRDSILMVSGQLNRQMYGPSIYPKLSKEVLQTQSRPGSGWGKSSPKEIARRSIYIHIKRTLIPPELSVFDFPETDTSCEGRFITTLPSQALNLLHGEFVQTQAGHLANLVRKEAGEEMTKRVQYALGLVLGHEADVETIADGLGLIERLVSPHNMEREEAFRQFCMMALNLNEFVYLD
ncbi:MAG: DUF1549 and DUF1553 domain-containing protein [Pirellulales bacterium]